MITVTVYPAKDGYRWHAKARNGRIVAESGEAYERSEDAATALRQLFGRCPVDLKIQHKDAKVPIRFGSLR